MDSNQLFALVIVGISLIGGMAIAIVAIKIAVPRSYDEKQAILEAQNRERLALIEKGADPATIFKKEKKASSDPLFWGLLLLGIGFGAFAGNMVWHQFNWATEATIINSMAFMGGGIALIIYYVIKGINNRNKAQ